MKKKMLLWAGVVLGLILISVYVTNNYSISEAEANVASPAEKEGKPAASPVVNSEANVSLEGKDESPATSVIQYENEAGKQAVSGAAAANEHADLEPAGDFTLTDLKGGTVALSDLRGKGVYLNFWATWCKWCKKEMPDMEKIYAEYKDKDLVILAVSVGEDRETVAKYIEDNGYTFDVLLDPDKTVAQQYQIKPIPVSLFIDRQGRIVYKKLGTMTEDQMRLKVEQILQ